MEPCAQLCLVVVAKRHAHVTFVLQDPCLELGVDDDHRNVLPLASELGLDVGGNRGGARAASPVRVHHHDRALVLGPMIAEEDVGLVVDAGVPARMDVDLVGERVAAEGEEAAGASEETLDHMPNLAVGDQEDAVGLRVQSSTPAAKRVPRSRVAFHSWSLGCSLPGMTSTAPFVSMRALSSSASSVWASTMGEWVEIHTWPP